MLFGSPRYGLHTDSLDQHLNFIPVSDTSCVTPTASCDCNSLDIENSSRQAALGLRHHILEVRSRDHEPSESLLKHSP